LLRVLQYDGLGAYELVGIPIFWSLVYRIVVYVIIHSEKTEEKEIMSDAQKILDERYAKGEITRKEYIQAKDDLNNFKPK